MIKIIVDAMGGDRSPVVNVKGVVKAINNIKDVKIVLVGDANQLTPLLNAEKFDGARLEIVHASEVIDCNEKPTEAKIGRAHV